MIVVREALRVARKVAVFGFPSGRTAFGYDCKLAEAYDRRGQDRPVWLDEHFQHQPFPTADLFRELHLGWKVTSFDNENVAFHNWVMRQQMHPLGVCLFMILLAAPPQLIERLLRRADRAPYYRKIVVVERL